MKIVWYPAGPRAFASSRLRVWKIADALSRRHEGRIFAFDDSPFGYTSFDGLEIKKADVVVIQKRTDMADMMQECRNQGIRVVFDVDDWMPNMPVGAADVITVDTPAKLELYPTAIVVPDALDVDANTVRKSAHADVLRNVVWTGNAENSYHLWNVAEACRRLGLDLTVITDIGSPSYAHFDGVTGMAWDVATVDAEMIKADVAVCPFVFNVTWSEEWVKSKSANKVFKAWALGLPVIGTGIPSYVDAGLQYCATSVDEWITALLQLGDPVAREADAERGRVIADQYTADKVALKWLEVFQEDNEQKGNSLKRHS